MISKEVRQLRRDRLTFAMMFGMPILQLLLFGYAIDTDPHHLPTAVLAADQSQITRTILSALSNTGYMRFTHRPKSEAEANELLQSGEVQFVVTIPSDFTRRLVRGERAQVLIDADATDPIAAANPLAAAAPAISQALARDMVGPLIGLRDKAESVDVVLQRRYNPEGKSRLNIVPGLLAVILTMTMVMMTALAVTRERERGTMENLLAMPVRPIEVMIGKIVPYIAIGAVQVVVILLVALASAVRRRRAGQPGAVLPRHGAVHHRQPGHQLYISPNAEPAQAMRAGSSDALSPAVRLMFPFRGVPASRRTRDGAPDSRRGVRGDPRRNVDRLRDGGAGAAVVVGLEPMPRSCWRAC
jgi:ABC-type Na+ efflux pump permease subunit